MFTDSASRRATRYSHTCAARFPGLGEPLARFEQFQRHHIQDTTALGGRGRQYDLTVYSIVKYFHLCMENNPNIIDSLFVPRNCILYSTPLGERVREHRRLFLHKGAWHKFKGYAFSQMHKMKTKQPVGKRKAIIAKYGYDVKFAYHVVRLLNEVEQILTEGDLTLDRNREQLKAIRRGEWSLPEIEDYFSLKERELESLYTRSTLPPAPDEGTIKELLLDCLEKHYGGLDGCIVRDDSALQALREIDRVLARVRGLYS